MIRNDDDRILAAPQYDEMREFNAIIFEFQNRSWVLRYGKGPADLR